MSKPARKLKRSAVKNIVRFPSTKTDGSRNILVESILESQFCLHLEFDSRVSRYYPQPETFQVPLPNNGTRQYTPDFEVHYTSGKTRFIEVKPLKKIESESYVELFNHFKIVAENVGAEFQVVDDTEILRQPLLANYKKLHRYRVRPSLDKRNLNRCAERISILMPLGKLMEELKLLWFQPVLRVQSRMITKREGEAVVTVRLCDTMQFGSPHLR